MPRIRRKKPFSKPEYTTVARDDHVEALKDVAEIYSHTFREK